MSTIIGLEAAAWDLKLREPFGIAGGAQHLAANAWCRLELDDGTFGLGEAAPFPAVNGETQRQALEDLSRARGLVVGRSALDWRRRARELTEAELAPSARCAVESALLDAWCRRARLSLRAFFGGHEARLVTDITLPTGSVAATTEGARRAVAAGFTRLKVKVGGAPLEHDVARLRATLAVAPEAELLLDANASLSAAEALELAASLGRERHRLVLFEQPTPKDDWDGLRRVREGGLQVAADESAQSARDVAALARARAVDVINLKITKCGVAEALDMALAARAHGLELMIGGMVESKLAMGVSASLACGLGGFRYVDLDTPMFLAEEPTRGGWLQDGATLSLEDVEHGHGVDVIR